MAVLALIGVTAIWGSTFVMVKDAIESMPYLDFLAWRFALATVAMVALRPRRSFSVSRPGWWAGLALGVALGLGYVFQTAGLQYVSPATSAFVTGMFVVFTPLTAAAVLRRRVARPVWVAVGLAVLGLVLLSPPGGGDALLGVVLTLGCALAFALQLIGLGEWSARHDPYPLAVVQLGVVAVGCFLAALGGGLAVPTEASVWLALVVTSLAATALAFLVQTWAQARVEATRAAVVMTMEPVFAGLFALAVGEALGPRGFAGGALIVLAMLAVEVAPRRRGRITPRLEV
jgi:drug/metabolite transporter (DMT)-like permease